MTRPLGKFQTVGDQTFWFCMECIDEGTHPGDPSWLELSETGAGDHFFSSELDLVLEHLERAHGHGPRQIEVGEDEIILK